MSNTSSPVLEVFADVGCPFTYVGLSHLIRSRDRRGSSVRVKVRAWPLELVNDAPFDTDHLAVEIVALRAQVEPELFTGFNAESFPKTSIPAFGLTHVAYEKDLDTGEAVSMELRQAIFEDGKDVSDPDVLAGIAARHGLDVPGPDESDGLARAEWADGKERGVIGSPHFLLPSGEGAFCPGLSIERLDDGSYKVEADHATMGAFFGQVFALG